jgi:hypothetical protein
MYILRKLAVKLIFSIALLVFVLWSTARFVPIDRYRPATLQQINRSLAQPISVRASELRLFPFLGVHLEDVSWGTIARIPQADLRILLASVPTRNRTMMFYAPSAQVEIRDGSLKGKLNLQEAMPRSHRKDEAPTEDEDRPVPLLDGKPVPGAPPPKRKETPSIFVTFGLRALEIDQIDVSTFLHGTEAHALLHRVHIEPSGETTVVTFEPVDGSLIGCPHPEGGGGRVSRVIVSRTQFVCFANR